MCARLRRRTDAIDSEALGNNKIVDKRSIPSAPGEPLVSPRQVTSEVSSDVTHGSGLYLLFNDVLQGFMSWTKLPVWEGPSVVFSWEVPRV